MSNTTKFSYGVINNDIKKTNNVILTNFINDINELEVDYININSELNTDIHDTEKSLGEVFKRKAKLRNSFKYMTELNIVNGQDEKAIITDVKRSCNSLRIDKIDILKIDINNHHVQLDEMLSALSTLKSENLVDKICFYNFKLNHTILLKEYCDKYNLNIDYIIINLPITKYKLFIEQYYLLIKILKTTVIFDNLIDNNNLKEYPLVDKFVKNTGYSASEFAILFLNCINCNKIINITTSNMKLFSELLKLQNKKLDQEQFDEFITLIKGDK